LSKAHDHIKTKPLIDFQKILNHPRNAQINFDPVPHTYHHTDEQGVVRQFKGVTGLIEDYGNYFDVEKISKAVAYKRGVPQQQVKDEWKKTNKEAIDRGNYVHDTLEHFVKTGEILDEALVDGFVKSYEAMGLTPIAAEWTIFDETIERASSIDGNFADADGRFVIVDYKTNKDGVKFEAYKDQRMSYPLQGLYDSKHSKYSLQVSMYRHWVEKYYLDPSEVSDVHWILHIVQDTEGVWQFRWIMSMDYREEIKLIYDDLNAIKQYQDNLIA
jgi:ATP-dependent exoDNAse (exonuclease V) beta subunit